MPNSGIKVDPEVAGLWNDMKINKLHKFLGFKLSDDLTKVVVDKELMGEKQETCCAEEDEKCFNQLRCCIACDKPRYILYDFGCKLPDGRDCKKIAFIYWCNENSPIKEKMVYTSTKDTVKKVFNGIAANFEIQEMQELDYNHLREEVVKKK